MKTLMLSLVCNQSIWHKWMSTLYKVGIVISQHVHDFYYVVRKKVINKEILKETPGMGRGQGRC